MSINTALEALKAKLEAEVAAGEKTVLNAFHELEASVKAHFDAEKHSLYEDGEADLKKVEGAAASAPTPAVEATGAPPPKLEAPV